MKSQLNHTTDCSKYNDTLCAEFGPHITTAMSLK